MNPVERKYSAIFDKEFWAKQTENAKLKYTINWKPVAEGNNVASSSWTTQNGSLTLESESLSSNQTSVIVSGQVGCARLINKVTLTDGQVDERIFNLTVMNNDRYWCDRDYGMGCC